jgi:hypothetical protein
MLLVNLMKIENFASIAESVGKLIKESKKVGEHRYKTV